MRNKRILGIISTLVLTLLALAFVRGFYGVMDTAAEARSRCGSSFFGIYDDSPFVDIVEVKSVNDEDVAFYDKAEIEKEWSFTCSNHTAQRHRKFLNTLQMAIYFIFWLPIVCLVLITRWLTSELKKRKK